MYDSFSMNKIYTIKAHSGNINAACISKDGVLLTQSNDKETKLWKLVDCSWLSNPLQTNNKHNAIVRFAVLIKAITILLIVFA